MRTLPIVTALAASVVTATAGLVCPPLAGLEAQMSPHQTFGAENRVDCQYVEAGDLPWPVGRLRLEWVTKGRPDSLSHLCTQVTDSAGEHLHHARGKAAMVSRRTHRDIADEALWIVGANLLLGQATGAVACPAPGSVAPTASAPYASAVASKPPPPPVFAPSARERPFPPARRKSALAKKLYVAAENLYYGKNGKKKDRTKALSFYLQAARHGHANAQYSLAYMLKNGQGVKVDLPRAFYWGKLAAKAGSGSAAGMVGNMCYFGKGAAKSFKEAAGWYRLGVAKNHGDSLYSLGYLYEHGEGVPKSIKTAFGYYKRGAAKGNASAMFELGECYFSGQGVASHKPLARQWMRKSAKKGNKSAKAWLKKHPR